MICEFSRFEVKIIEKPCIISNNTYQQSAIITTFDFENKIIETQEFSYVSQEIIAELLNKNDELFLDNCYIKNFNYKTVDNYYSENINIKFKTAQNSFFDSQNSVIDFSNSDFHILSSLKDSIFIAETINFANSKFQAKEINFENTNFLCNKIDFSKAIFTTGCVSFKNSFFSNSIKEFYDIKFGKGNKNFVNTNFGEGDINFSGTYFNSGRTSFKIARFGKGKIDFSRTRFGRDEISFEQTEFGEGELSFRSAVFRAGKVNFTSTKFGKGETSFIGTDFGTGSIVFKNANFNDGKKSFRLANFGGGAVDFHFSSFGKGDKIFDSTIFKSGQIDFKAVNFGTGKVSFKNVKIGDGDIIFEGTSLIGSFSITNSVFGNGEFNFQEAEFDKAQVAIQNVDFGLGKVTFFKSKFASFSLKGSQINNYFDLRVISCGDLDLSDTVIKDIVDIHPHEFRSEINAFDISGMRLLGRLYIDWRESKIKELILKQNNSYKTKEEQFRTLKENYNSTGEYSFEDEAYVEFKRMEAKSIRKEKTRQKPKFKIAFDIEYFFKWIVFDRMGKFATAPLRVLITMIISFIGFTLVYILTEYIGESHIHSSLFEPGDPRILPTVGKALYHSVITFLTIGYGDYYPTGIARWISGMEGFVGLFEMSYFTVAFVRKVLR